MKVQKGGRKTRKGAKAARNIKKLKQTYDKLKFHGVKELMRTMKEIKKYLIQKASRKCKELKAIDPATDASSSELTKHLEHIQAIKVAALHHAILICLHRLFLKIYWSILPLHFLLVTSLILMRMLAWYLSSLRINDS